MSEELYYLQNKNAGFLGNAPIWYAKPSGYTAYLKGAEKFTKHDAEYYTQQDSNKWAMFKCKDIDARLHCVFDSQDFHRLGTNKPNGWENTAYCREQELLDTIKELRDSFSEVLRISDREHTAWDKAKQALDKTKDTR